MQGPMNLNLDQKVSLVTGGTRGIGRAVVESLARHGSTVLFTYVSSEAAAHDFEQSLRAKGYFVQAVRADVCEAEGMAQLIEMIEAEHGRLDILINNAGVIRDTLIMGMEEEDWSDVINTNLTGAFHAIKPASRLMARKRQGAIVNISSVAATRPGRGHCNYAASKGGLEAMTRALAVELAGRNIRVNCVAPGMIETDMSKDVRDLAGDQILERILLRRFGQPDDVANAVMFLASDLASYITGTVMHVDGGVGA